MNPSPLSAANLVDLWACVAAAVGGAALAVRANMLKPTQGAFAKAPWPVRAGLSALAIALGMGAITIGSGDHATPREAMVYSVLAVAALVMAWNLHRNGRESDLVARLHGRAGLIMTVSPRLDPEALAIFQRHGARAPASKGERRP